MNRFVDMLALDLDKIKRDRHHMEKAFANYAQKIENKIMNKEFQIKVVVGQHNSVALLDCSSAIVSQDISEIGFGSWWETALPQAPVERGEWIIKGKIEEEEFCPVYYDVTFEKNNKT